MMKVTLISVDLEAALKLARQFDREYPYDRIGPARSMVYHCCGGVLRIAYRTPTNTIVVRDCK